MHAYLIISNREQTTDNKLAELQKKLEINKTLEFPLQKIEDVRSLEYFTKLKVSEPTSILIKNIDEAGAEAVNAFLKNLEEPQENLYFFLTASSLAKVLPTISSRCQVIKSTNKQIYKSTNYEEVEKFTTMTIGQKLAFLDKIKGKDVALNFLEDLTAYYHQKLHSEAGYSEKNANLGEISRILGNIDTTLNDIKANGNVALHMANMAININ